MPTTKKSNTHDDIDRDRKEETAQESIRPDFLQDLGISPEEQAGMEARAVSGADQDMAAKSDLSAKGIESAEAAGATPAKTNADNNESEAATADSSSGGLYSGSEKGKKKSRFSKRQKLIGGSLGGIGIGGIIALFSTVQGPLQFIHKAQFFQKAHFGSQDSFSDDRSAKFMLYAFSGKAAKGRLGVLGNKVADRMEVRLNRQGLKSVYHPNTGRLMGYQITDAKKANEFVRDSRKDDIPRNDGLAHGTDVNGKPLGEPNDFIDLRDSKFKQRRSVTRRATKTLGINRVSSSVSSRLMIKRGGVNFHPITNKGKKAIDDYFDRRRQIRDADDNDTRTGNPDGGDSPNLSKRSKILAKLKSFGTKLSGPTAVAGAVCAVKSFSDAIDAQNYENQQQLIRKGMKVVTVGNQVMSGQDLNMETLAVLSEAHYDEETNTTWRSDPGVQWEAGDEPTGKDYNKDVRPGSREKPAIFTTVEGIPDFGACAVIDTAGNLPVIKQFGELVTGGLKAIGIDTDKYAQMAIDYFTTGAVNLAAQGAEAGGLENIGLRLAASEKGIAKGARELTQEEEAEVKSLTRTEQKVEAAEANTFDKYFNLLDYQSVASQAFDAVPSSSEQVVASITSIPKIFSSMAGNLFGRSKVSAAATYDYGFPLYDFSLSERANLDYEDPYANAEYMEEGDRLKRMNETYGNKCFGMQVDESGNLVFDKAPDQAKIPSECKDTSNKELVSYRFYLADMIGGHSLACYMSIETSCAQVTTGTTPASPTSPGPSNGQIVGDPYTDSTSVPCAEGTREVGTADGYHEGQKFAVRLCSLPNLPSSGPADNPGSAYTTPGADGHAIVNSRVSGAWFSLVNDAKTAGINLAAYSSFRSMPHQEYLWVKHGRDTARVARPGYSSHQAGVAIDFQQMSNSNKSNSCASRARTPSNPGWVWLRDNAETYGFKQFSNEAWHWDALPMANRCGTAQP